MEGSKNQTEWIKREICDMIEFCKLNQLPLTRHSLLMVLVSINLDEAENSIDHRDLANLAEISACRCSLELLETNRKQPN